MENVPDTFSRFSQHHTPGHYGLESYIPVPIFRRDGTFFGTFCAIDSVPANVEDPIVLQSLKLYSELIGLQLEIAEELVSARDRLLAAEQREELIAIGEREVRDLFQPVVTKLYLLRTPPSLSEEARVHVEHMEASCEQISRLLQRKLAQVYERIEGVYPYRVAGLDRRSEIVPGTLFRHLFPRMAQASLTQGSFNW